MRLVVSLVITAALAGCHVSQPDGARCMSRIECKSDSCISGYCAGGGCSCPGNSDCTSNDCSPGWLCRYYPPDPVTGFFGNPGSHHCVPLCGACPPDFTCPTPGSASECQYVPPKLTVDAGGPYTGRVGQTIAFHARASSPVAPIKSYTWQLGDGTMAMGADVTHAYAAPFSGQVDLLVADEVDDTAGTTAQITIQ